MRTDCGICKNLQKINTQRKVGQVGKNGFSQTTYILQGCVG